MCFFIFFLLKQMNWFVNISYILYYHYLLTFQYMLYKSPDKSWLAVGTYKGYISIYDIRYQVMSQLYQHSYRQPIHRMAVCKSFQHATATAFSTSTSSKYSEDVIDLYEYIYIQSISCVLSLL